MTRRKTKSVFKEKVHEPCQEHIRTAFRHEGAIADHLYAAKKGELVDKALLKEGRAYRCREPLIVGVCGEDLAVYIFTVWKLLSDGAYLYVKAADSPPRTLKVTNEFIEDIEDIEAELFVESAAERIGKIADGIERCLEFGLERSELLLSRGEPDAREAGMSAFMGAFSGAVKDLAAEGVLPVVTALKYEAFMMGNLRKLLHELDTKYR